MQDGVASRPATRLRRHALSASPQHLGLVISDLNPPKIQRAHSTFSFSSNHLRAKNRHRSTHTEDLTLFSLKAVGKVPGDAGRIQYRRARNLPGKRWSSIRLAKARGAPSSSHIGERGTCGGAHDCYNAKIRAGRCACSHLLLVDIVMRLHFGVTEWGSLLRGGLEFFGLCLSSRLALVLVYERRGGGMYMGVCSTFG
ncbi:hypothetical protein PENSPDRAFT_244668 [Peniophora sp. CONT]|nr:hypothetical protein PENSPDRAFT_244668 [Peniophora sp. CONT]